MANLPTRIETVFEPVRCAFAERTHVLVEIDELAQLIEQANGMASRVRAARFLVDEQLAEGAGPEIGSWHVATPQMAANASQSSPAAKTRLRMRLSGMSVLLSFIARGVMRTETWLVRVGLLAGYRKPIGWLVVANYSHIRIWQSQQMRIIFI
jgi:hypothetical protein